jgi:hypothetical protein
MPALLPQHIPLLPRKAWEKVADRPDEGSYFRHDLWNKEPSPALRAPSPIAAQRERGNEMMSFYRSDGYG